MPPRAAADSSPADPPRAAAERILAAAARRVRAHGAADTSLQDVAAEAGVSKALIHYHFRNREALLARLVASLAEGVVARERAALVDAPPAAAVDRLWGWLADELARGDVRVLAELAGMPAPEVRRATADAARARLAAAAETVERLFDLLGLRPRVPSPMLAAVTTAFVDGLAVHAAIDGAANPRVAYDVFWLALLGMAE
jgi:AcrR family transcriptional regulator